MDQVVSLPLWLVLLAGLLALLGLLDRLLVPGVRWILRRRVNRLIEEVSTRLQLGIKPFTLTKRQVLIDRLIYDPLVLEEVEARASERGVPRKVLMEEVERSAREIVPAFNAIIYFKVGYWLAKRFASSLFRVRLGFIDEAGLDAIPEDATVVFVMNHRSNMDYVLVSFLVAERSVLSYAVGEWARVWGLQSLIRAMGAYFVRRSSGDPLYRRVLERYVGMATEGGVTQAVFPEGRLSRDGFLGEPKLGLLDYMIRSFDVEGSRDICFVPVGINYDRVLEDRTLLGGKPDARSRVRTVLGSARFMLKNLLLLIRGRWYRFGYACVNFGAPVSLKQFLKDESLELSALEKEQRFASIGVLSKRIMDEIGSVIPVLPVSLIASVFLRSAERELSALEIKAGIHELKKALKANGAHVYLPRDNDDYLIEVGLRMLELRRILKHKESSYSVNASNRALLQYYANSIAHLLPARAAGDESVNAAVSDQVA